MIDYNWSNYWSIISFIEFLNDKDIFNLDFDETSSKDIFYLGLLFGEGKTISLSKEIDSNNKFYKLISKWCNNKPSIENNFKYGTFYTYQKGIIDYDTCLKEAKNIAYCQTICFNYDPNDLQLIFYLGIIFSLTYHNKEKEVKVLNNPVLDNDFTSSVIPILSTLNKEINNIIKL